LNDVQGRTSMDSIVESRPSPEEAVEVIRHIVRLSPPQYIKLWGPKPYDALIMELLISTLSHALNEDLLVARLRRLQVTEPAALSPSRLADIEATEVARWFGLNETLRSKRSPQKLADLIRMNFRHIRGDGDQHARQIFDSDSIGSLGDIWEWLAHFPVFKEDPLQKKSALILQRLYLQGYLPSDKYAKLPFAVDRHIVRLFLRLGWISVHTPTLRQKVSQRRILSAEEDTALRTNARLVMSDLAQRSGLSHAELNYALWQFARSYCARHDPGCMSSQPTLAGRRADLAPEDNSVCRMANWCSSFRSGTVLDTLDPVHRGNLY
jgi:hypothetical protein